MVQRLCFSISVQRPEAASQIYVPVVKTLVLAVAKNTGEVLHIYGRIA